MTHFWLAPYRGQDNSSDMELRTPASTWYMPQLKFVPGLPEVFADEVDDADVLFAGPDDADDAVAVIGAQQGLPVGRRIHEVLHALVGEL